MGNDEKAAEFARRWREKSARGGRAKNPLSKEERSRAGRVAKGTQVEFELIQEVVAELRAEEAGG